MHINPVFPLVSNPAIKIALEAFQLMCEARAMSDCYEQNKVFAARYVHATSRGHEAIQIAIGKHLQGQDYASPYYRDDAMLLAMGLSPTDLMLQLMAKADDPFSGGRTYYSHPSLKRPNFPTIPHQSSATGMQAIPATGMAHGLKYLEQHNLLEPGKKPIVLCSFGDGSVTEGEVSEAFQMAALKQLPILFLVQDNGWSISATHQETSSGSAYDYALGFPGLERRKVDGANFEASWNVVSEAVSYVRNMRSPLLLHATVPLLGHHTSGVRKEWYRSELEIAKHLQDDPFPKLYNFLLSNGLEAGFLNQMVEKAREQIGLVFETVKTFPEPNINSVENNIFAETSIFVEMGERSPAGSEKILMVDAALHAMEEILTDYPEALLYGEDVGNNLGGVFREAAQLAKKFGDGRVFNTPIQEAYIIGSTAGMSAVGLKPIVEVQFADYVWPGINQLVTELSRSCYLSNGKFPIQSLIRIPIGAYGSGGPYHSSSIESALLSIRGIKVVYPSNAADMKGLMKSAFLDPNPVVMLEHKGLYWSKVPGTDEAKTFEPSRDYIIPLGKARIVQYASPEKVAQGESMVIITYGMGVYWARNLDAEIKESIEIIDLRTLHPLDFDCLTEAVERHGKALIVTEESIENSFAEALAGRLTIACFKYLDGPIRTVGALNVPAIPLNAELEKAVLPNSKKLKQTVIEILNE